MDETTDRTNPRRRRFIIAAWASALVAVLVSLVLWLWFANHLGTRGERLNGVLLLYAGLGIVSTAAVGAAIYGLCGIRSWRQALVIVPGAAVGVGVNGTNACLCVLAYLLEGYNLGG